MKTRKIVKDKKKWKEIAYGKIWNVTPYTYGYYKDVIIYYIYIKILSNYLIVTLLYWIIFNLNEK